MILLDTNVVSEPLKAFFIPRQAQGKRNKTPRRVMVCKRNVKCFCFARDFLPCRLIRYNRTLGKHCRHRQINCSDDVFCGKFHLHFGDMKPMGSPKESMNFVGFADAKLTITNRNGSKNEMGRQPRVGQHRGSSRRGTR